MTESARRLHHAQLAAMAPRDRRLWVDLTAAAYLTALEARDAPEWQRIRSLAAGDADLTAALDETLDALTEEYEAARDGA